jgi:hypothetical protein
VPLCWIVHELDGEPSVFVEEASSLIYARMKANSAGHAGKFIEAHELDQRTSRKPPRDVLGRTLSRAKANSGSGTASDDESPMKLLAIPGALRLLRAYADIDDSNVSGSIVDLVRRISRQRA